MKQRSASLETLEEPTESERVTPTDAFQAPVLDPDATLLAMPALLPFAPLPTPCPASPGPAATEPSPGPSPSPPERRSRASFANSFQGASWPKRLTVLLLPVAIGLFAIKAVRQRSEASPTRPRVAASASASVVIGSAHAATIDPAPTSPPLPAHPPSPADDTHAAGLTLQRRAVNAFASGNFPEAAQLYQRLAEENPDQAAFAVAARLARERANGVGHD